VRDFEIIHSFIIHPYTDLFQALLRGKLPEDAIERLSSFMNNTPGSGTTSKEKITYVSREQFVKCVVQALKGSNEQMAAILVSLTPSSRLGDISKVLKLAPCFHHHELC